MNRLETYLLRQILNAFIFAAAAVAMVVLFTQSFRLLSLVIDNSSTMWIFFELMALSIPTFMPLILPLGLGVAIIFVYNKLAVDSELVVMRAAGMSPARQALPAIALAGMTFFVCLLLTLWISPAANGSLVTLQYKIRDNYAVFLSRPGNFNDITQGLTFYAARRGSGGALENILIHDVRKPESPVTTMANSGQVVNKDGQSQIVIFNGRRQEMDLATGRLSELAFDQYVLDLAALRNASGERQPDPREQSIGELLSDGPNSTHATHERLVAELHQRFASPLLAITYTLIGLAAILAGEFNRRGMGKRILIAAIVIIVVQAAFMSVNSMVVRNNWLAFALYLVPLLPVPVCLMLINSEQIKHRLTALFSAENAAS